MTQLACSGSDFRYLLQIAHNLSRSWTPRGEGHHIKSALLYRTFMYLMLGSQIIPVIAEPCPCIFEVCVIYHSEVRDMTYYITKGKRFKQFVPFCTNCRWVRERLQSPSVTVIPWFLVFEQWNWTLWSKQHFTGLKLWATSKLLFRLL